ncbi:Brp/Blh family beta-carotene 15,15'-monooxygenase [Oxalobacteraceae bacterium GrIS 2.11]
MRQIQTQGLVFSCFAVLISLTSILMGPMDLFSTLLLVSPMILILGVPHGALDPVFAKHLFSIDTWRTWAKFTLLYAILSLSVIVTWWIFPLSFMAGFLMLSALHFSRDLTRSTLKLTRILYGGAIIILPTLLHSDQVTELFALMLNQEMGRQIVTFLKVLAWPWLIISTGAICIELRKNWRTGLEFGSVCLLTVLVQPLVAFAVFFCAMHSCRHIMRTHFYSELSFKKLLLISLAPMVGTILLATAGWLYLPSSPDYPRIVQFLFVMLAALTLPHMLLIERIEFAH